MDSRLQELVDFTKEEIGLESYYLHTANIYWDKSIFNNTDYTLLMEWFPNGIMERTEEDLNPPGTAVVELDLKTRRFKSIIFVGEKTLINTLVFDKHDSKKIIRWIEQKTGLVYHEQFQIKKKEGTKTIFQACFHGIPASPSGYIEVKLDDVGRLLFFSISGSFPSNDLVEAIDYTLTFDHDVKQVAHKHLKLLELPSSKQEKWLSMYTMEEIYVYNNRKIRIPFEINVHSSYVKVDQVIEWDSPINKKFERQQLNLRNDSITAEQAFSFESHPDTLPLTKHEQDITIAEVLDFLRKEFPKDTAKWVLVSLYRDRGYIIAELKQAQDIRAFQRKLKVFIDSTKYKALNYFDNQYFLATLKHYHASDTVNITKEEAFEKIKNKIELTPVYVYDFEQKSYVLCGKLGSQYGVLANTGDVMELDKV
ncbi:hypothetical protein P4S95_05105 [Aneurinibacillus aneurinilyticus]|uniref:hypothetical protein n=1 Tax=Aneurinibacillus aneurinilyticus TaxID=1391 RepID=UPI002E1B29A7|nr:hypothetical protein [Aneurinibacillus aneurinilyticus]